MAKKAEIEQTVIEAPYELPEGWCFDFAQQPCLFIERSRNERNEIRRNDKWNTN